MSVVTTFQLHRSSLVLIALLAVLVCGLMFTAGLSVGLYWQLPAEGNEVAADAVTPLPTDVPAPARRLDAPAPSVAEPSVAGPSIAVPSVTGPSVTGPSVTAPSASSAGVDGPSVRGPRVTEPSLRPPPLSTVVTSASLGLESDEPPAAAEPLAADPAVADDAATRPAAQSALQAGAPTASQSDPQPGAQSDAQSGAQPGGPADAAQPAFAIQLGAFLVDENTQDLVQELQRRGLEPFVVRTPTADHLVMQSVRIGPYPSRREALRTVETLRSSQGLDGFVVRTAPRLE